MSWRLLGLVPFLHAEGHDVTRSAAERAAGESIWVPSAVAPGTGTTWSVRDPHTITATIDTDGHLVAVEHHIDTEGLLVSSSFDRWGDPDRSGTSGLHRFGVDVTAQRRFGTTTVPSRGEAGWHHGTDRWSEGRFFRFELVDWKPFP
jgi:hypothetical protein